MMKFTVLRQALSSLAVVATLSGLATGQAGMLMTPLALSAPGPATIGNMFDVVNLNPVNPIAMCCVSQNCSAAAGVMTSWTIYTKTGTWVGFTANAPVAWTQVGTVTNVISRGPGQLTPIPIDLSALSIAVGATRAFYFIASSGGINAGGTISPPGTAVGTPSTFDPNLQIREGCGRGARTTPFAGLVVQPVKWQGSFTYGPAGFQVNQTGSAARINGKAGTACCKAVTSVTANNICTFGAVTFDFMSTNIGLPWDLAITGGPAIPTYAGGSLTGSGQSININFFDPDFHFIGNAQFAVPFPGPFSGTLAPGGPFTATCQMINLDPTLPDLFALSQPNDYDVTAVPPTPNPPAPTGDNDAATFNFAATTGVCSFGFFGTSFTEFAVTTNGRVMFGGSSVAFTPSVANAMIAPGTAGVWCDLDQSLGGSITVASPGPSIAQVNWIGIPYAGQPLTSNTFSVRMDQYNNNITFFGLNTVAMGAGSQFVGLSEGAGATNPGSHVFTLGFNAGPPLLTDMFYRFGTAGSLTPGLYALVFAPPVGGPAYNATGF